jgi:hypothetical protein
MKRPYEKPTLTDLSLPTARAGWLSGGGNSPQGKCATGDGASPGICGNGNHPSTSGMCFTGDGDAGGNLCQSGLTVVK